MSEGTGLIERFRHAACGRLSRNSERTYIGWLRAFSRFLDRKPASQWRSADISAWIFSLANVDPPYAGKSMSQALCAVIFVFKHVLQIDPGTLALPPMQRPPKTIKIIPTREELGRIFAGLRGQDRLKAAVMYGGGTRVEECCRLRVHDIDFENLTIRVHGGKGDKDRLTLLPIALVPALRRQIEWRRALHEIDLAEGAGLVDLPGRLSIKYPNANRELGWQFFFPSSIRRGQYRWYSVPEAFQKAMRKAVCAAGILKQVTPHTLRHAFTTHALQDGNDISTVSDLLGHERIETTAIYAHGDAARGFSPLDCRIARKRTVRIASLPSHLLSP